MKFSDEERQTRVLLGCESPVWGIAEKLFNPSIPNSYRLNARPVFSVEGALSSSASKNNLSLLTTLRECLIQNGIQAFDNLFPLEDTKHLKKIEKRTHLSTWLKHATDADLGLISASGFCLFKPFDEKKLIEKLHVQGFTSCTIQYEKEQQFVYKYWFSVWKMACAHPLNAELTFGIGSELISMIANLDIDGISTFIKDETAFKFQWRHCDKILNLIIEHANDRKTLTVLRFLRDMRVLQEKDEESALGYDSGKPLEADIGFSIRPGFEDCCTLKDLSIKESILQLKKQNLSVEQIAKELALDISEVRYVIGNSLRAQILNIKQDTSDEALRRHVQKFIFEELFCIGIEPDWIKQTWKNYVHKTYISNYAQNNSYQDLLSINFAKRSYALATRFPSSCVHSYRRYLSNHLQRISGTAFLILYNLIGTASTMEYCSHRNMIVALIKLNTLLNKEYYKSLSIEPISENQALFLVREWSQKRISLNYCTMCGHVYAAPNLPEGNTSTSRTFGDRLSHCPFCQFLSRTENFESKEISDAIRHELLTDFEFEN